MMQASSPPRSADRESNVANRELCEASAVELAALVRNRSVSALELCEVTIDRIERVNPVVNAIAHQRFEEARREARRADEITATRPRELPPFHGVPCTIKDFFAVTGVPQTGGLVTRREHVSTEDAALVARLREAGAIVVATTNVPEGGLWMETHNSIFGRTNNPWDPARTSGGSSGGEGAIVASGGSPIGLGSDIGGSVRIPAAFCGTVGHKPSGRLLPNAGQWPRPEGPALAYLCPGPLVRRVADVMPLLRVMAGPHPGDVFCKEMVLGDPDSVDVRDLVVYPMEHNGRTRVSGVMRRAVRDAARALADRGATVREIELPRMRRAVEIWAAMVETDAGVHYDEILASGSGKGRIRPFVELARWSVGQSKHTFPALLLAAANQLTAPFGKLRAQLFEEGRALKAELDALLGDRGVLLHPPYSRPAPLHHDAWRTPLDAACTAIFNVLEVPVTVVPTGFCPQGMPVAVQIVAGCGRDHVSIAAASVVEEAFGGWVMATPAAKG